LPAALLASAAAAFHVLCAGRFRRTIDVPAYGAGNSAVASAVIAAPVRALELWTLQRARIYFLGPAEELRAAAIQRRGVGFARRRSGQSTRKPWRAGVGIDLPKLDANLTPTPATACSWAGPRESEPLSAGLLSRSDLFPPFIMGYRRARFSLTRRSCRRPRILLQARLPSDSRRNACAQALCKGSGLESTGPSVSAPGEIRYLAAKRLESPWILFQADHDAALSAAETAQFIATMQGAALVTLTATGSDYTPFDTWAPKLLAAFDTLVARAAAETLPTRSGGAGRPAVVEVPAQPSTAVTDTFAIVMSGTAWAGLDKEVAEALSAHGIRLSGSIPCATSGAHARQKGLREIPTT